MLAFSFVDPTDLITALENSLESWSRLLFWATVLVVLGLVLEYFFEIPECIREFRNAWRSIPRRILLKPIFIIVGGIFITVGVSGELLIQFMASRDETSLRNLNDRALADIHKEASDASARAAKDDKEAAGLQKQAEDERLERIKLEAIVAPRSLSLDQQKQLKSVCSQFRGHNILVTSYGTDGEAAVLGGQLIGVFQAAGFNVLDSRASLMVAGSFDLGVHVRGPATEKDFADCLGKELINIGHLAVWVNDPEPRLGAAMGGGGAAFPAGTAFLTVRVGVKPVPVMQQRPKP